jgi:hypothetical protein
MENEEFIASLAVVKCAQDETIGDYGLPNRHKAGISAECGLRRSRYEIDKVDGDATGG